MGTPTKMERHSIPPQPWACILSNQSQDDRFDENDKCVLCLAPRADHGIVVDRPAPPEPPRPIPTPHPLAGNCERCGRKCDGRIGKLRPIKGKLICGHCHK